MWGGRCGVVAAVLRFEIATITRSSEPACDWDVDDTTHRRMLPLKDEEVGP